MTTYNFRRFLLVTLPMLCAISFGDQELKINLTYGLHASDSPPKIGMDINAAIILGQGERNYRLLQDDATDDILKDPLRSVCPQSFIPDDSVDNPLRLCKPRSCAIVSVFTSFPENNYYTSYSYKHSSSEGINNTYPSKDTNNTYSSMHTGKNSSLMYVNNNSSSIVANTNFSPMGNKNNFSPININNNSSKVDTNNNSSSMDTKKGFLTVDADNNLSKMNPSNNLANNFSAIYNHDNSSMPSIFIETMSTINNSSTSDRINGYSTMDRNKSFLTTIERGNSEKTAELPSRTICKSFSKKFQNCSKTLLKDGEFLINAWSGEATVFADNSRRALGDYFRQGATLLICTNQTNQTNATTQKPEVDTTEKPEILSLPQWCSPFVIPETRYSILANASLIMKDVASGAIEPRYYFHTVSENRTKIIHVCPKVSLDILLCENVHYTRMKILPDMRLMLLKSGRVLKLGDYILSRDGSKAVVCRGTPKVKLHKIPYGILASISCACVLLTLLAHLWIPNLNLHCKPLICLLISLFGFYLGLAVQKLCGPFKSDCIRYSIFILRQVMGLGSFFWLNVQSFDMWYGFAHLIRGSSSASTNKHNKRRFFIKCGYAWGVPVLLCAAVLGINGSESAQRALNLQLDIGGTGWFHSTKSIFIFFYVPIIIILIENVIFFALTIVNIRKASKGTDILNKRVSRQLLVVFAKLFVVMGICWFFEILSFALANRTSESAWYFTDSINLLQGVFIFFVYVFKRATIKIIRAKLGYPMENGGSQVTKSTSSSQQDNRKTSVASAGNQAKKKGVEMTTKVAEGKQNGGEREDCQTKC